MDLDELRKKLIQASQSKLLNNFTAGAAGAAVGSPRKKRTISPVPESKPSTFTRPSLNNLRQNITRPTNWLSPVQQNIRTAPTKFLDKLKFNTKMLRERQDVRDSAASTAGDFIRGDFGLSKKSEDSTIDQFRQQLGDTAQASLSGFLRVSEGAAKQVDPLSSKIEGPGGLGGILIGARSQNLDRIGGYADIISGAATMFGTTTLPFQGATFISNTESLDSADNGKRLRRLAAGYQSAYAPSEDLDQNVPDQNITFDVPFVGEVTFDPWKQLGRMFGFVSRPENKQLFKATEAAMPGVQSSLGKWFLVTGIRGSIEDIILSLDEMPENPTDKELIQFFGEAGLRGAISEIVARGAFKAVGAGATKISDTEIGQSLRRAFNELKGAEDTLKKPEVQEYLRDAQGRFTAEDTRPGEFIGDVRQELGESRFGDDQRFFGVEFKKTDADQLKLGEIDAARLNPGPDNSRFSVEQDGVFRSVADDVRSGNFPNRPGDPKTEQVDEVLKTLWSQFKKDAPFPQSYEKAVTDLQAISNKGAFGSSFDTVKASGYDFPKDDTDSALLQEARKYKDGSITDFLPIKKQGGYRNTYSILNKEGDSVGQIIVGLDAKNNAMNIREIAVDQKGTGIGTEVVQGIKAWANENGLKTTVSDVEPHAVDFWKKNGIEINNVLKGDTFSKVTGTDLLSEARKYKSAEEFVEAMEANRARTRVTKDTGAPFEDVVKEGEFVKGVGIKELDELMPSTGRGRHGQLTDIYNQAKGGESLLNKLGEAQKNGDIEAEQAITDQLRLQDEIKAQEYKIPKEGPEEFSVKTQQSEARTDEDLIQENMKNYYKAKTGGSNPPPDFGGPPKVDPETMKVESDGLLQTWRNKTLAAQQKANAQAQQFANIPEEDGWKIVKYMQNPSEAKAKELGLDATKYESDIQALRETYNSLRAEGQQRGLEIGFIDNYVNQVWKESPAEIMEMIDDYPRGAGKVPSFVKERTIPSYEEGLKFGLTPEYTHPAQLVGHYRMQLEKAEASQKMLDMFLQSGIIRDADSAPVNWKVIDAPYVKDLNGKAAPKPIADELSNIFGTQPDNIVTRLAGVGADISRYMQDITLSGGVKTLNAFSLANLQKEVMSGRVFGPLRAFATSFSQDASNSYFRANQEYMEEMAERGIRMHTSNDYQTMFKNLEESTSLKETIGDGWDSWVTDPTFKRFLPMLQVEFYKDARLAGMNADEAAEATHHFYGTIDDFKRSDLVKDIATSTLFARQFRESMLNFWAQTAKSLNPKNFGNKAYRQNQKFVVGAIITYLLMNEANKRLNDGRNMWENKSGKEFSVEIPRGEGRSWYIPFLSSIATVPRRALEATSELMSGDIAGAAERIGTFASQPLNLASEVLANRTFYGGPIYQEDDPAFQKLAKTAGYAAEQTTHPFIGEPLAVVQGRKTPLEAAMGMLELPVYPSVSTELSHMTRAQREKYQELKATDPILAEDYLKQSLVEEEDGGIYESDDESPEGFEKVAVNTTSLFANPVETVQLWYKGEPIRKTTLSGDTPLEKALNFFDLITVSERAKGTSTLDYGDKSTQVDHIKPKWLGGREEASNYQILTNEEHRQKTQLGKTLREQYEAGDISKKEAWEAVQEFNTSLNTEPVSEDEVNVLFGDRKVSKTGNVEDTQKDIVKSKIRLGVDLSDSDIAVHYGINELGNRPDDPVEAIKWEQKAYSAARKMLNDTDADVSGDKKYELIQQMGIEPEDVEYYDLAQEDSIVRSVFAREAASEIASRSNNRQDVLEALVKLRREVLGKRVLSDSIVNDLVDQGIISKEEGKIIKSFKWDKESGDVKLKVSGRGRSAKLKSIKFVPVDFTSGRGASIPSIRGLQAPRIPSEIPVAFRQPTAQVAVPTAPQFKVDFNL